MQKNKNLIQTNIHSGNLEKDYSILLLYVCTSSFINNPIYCFLTIKNHS